MADENTIDQKSILQLVEETAAIETNVPAGYQRIVMSTMGKYGAPQVLHIRNFSVEEALELGSIAQDEIPIKITSLLQRLIYEEDVDIRTFYEQEVSELCIHFYQAFYSHQLKDIKYTPDEEDKKWVLENIYKNQNGADYQNWLRGVENGQIPLNYDIDLNRVRYFKIPDNPKKFIRYKRGNFECKFQYPRFGDTALLQKAIQEKFRTEDRQIGPLYDIFKKKRDAEQRRLRGENVAVENLPDLNPDDVQVVRKYELDKTSYTIQQMKGLYLVEFNGEDISGRPLSERVEIAKDPRIDFSMYQTVQECFNKLEIGPYSKITIANPINGLPKEIDHPFRSLELLAAIKDYRPDDSVIEFE